MSDDLKDVCNAICVEIEHLKAYVRELHGHREFCQSWQQAVPESILDDRKCEARANITLAYRYLEDARMRLGKVIQAWEGKDILDTPDLLRQRADELDDKVPCAKAPILRLCSTMAW